MTLIEDDDDGAAGKCRRVRFHAYSTKQRLFGNRITTAKYNLFTFLPFFLFQQFKRFSNCFFLTIALLQQIPDVSPSGRYNTLVPLLLIMGMSATKEIIEDRKRHRADEETNKRLVDVLHKSGWTSVACQQIEVGNFVRIWDGAFFPADLLLLSSSDEHSVCNIETANLDGETNLKIRIALPVTTVLSNAVALSQLEGDILCDLPNPNLYEFNGTLRLANQEPFSLGADQLLQRGTSLKNTQWAIGIVVYSGRETKIYQKSPKTAPLKHSRVDQETNNQMLCFCLLLLVVCLTVSGCNQWWISNYGSLHWYLGLEDLTTISFGYAFLTFLILFNSLIPVSMTLTIEVVRYIQAIFIDKDVEMYCAETNTPAYTITSSLNEELGQVKYVFSDKTGTLTQNIMKFYQMSVMGTIYPVTNAVGSSTLLSASSMQNLPNAPFVREFLTLLSVCHTVLPERDVNSPVGMCYRASSPDERALVEGAASLGWVLYSRTPDSLTVKFEDSEHRYELLHVLEFNSERKRMSVIVRAPSKKIKLFCKGADSVIYDRLCNTPPTAAEETIRELTLNHMEAFASQGFRTLCCAVKEIPPADYEEWNDMYQRVSTSMENREEKMANAADLIERDLVLLGVTAIEDKLQHGVPETLAALLDASIRVWILTGDKQTTAINIGYSSRLLNSGMKILVINEQSCEAVRQIMGRWQNPPPGSAKCPANASTSSLALVVDGNTLKMILNNDLKSDFIELCLQCQAVLCCRVTPSQKAAVVEAVREKSNGVTLAIGDGANDVAMIQTAHVGVGISGMEGLQAVGASDYSIAQFRFLRRLLFVHGASSYYRTSRLILYSFYKNVVFLVMELWFAIYSGWSGQILFERWTIAFYNVLFTVAPPLALGLFDRRFSASVSFQYPHLYQSSQTSQYFNLKVFSIWTLQALFHSVFIFWLLLNIYREDVVWSNGKNGDYLVLGNAVYTCVIVTVILKAALEKSSWTWLSLLAFGGSIVIWLIFLLVYSEIWTSMFVTADMAGMATILMTSPVFWTAAVVLVPVATLTLDIFYNTITTTISLLRGEPGNIRENQRKCYCPKWVQKVRRLRRSRISPENALQPDIELLRF